MRDEQPPEEPSPAGPEIDRGIRISIFSDVICPWCYLGHRRFGAALGELELDPTNVHFRAFQLDPTATAEPADLRRSLESKYGPGAFDSMTRRLTELGGAEGIDYRFDLAQRVSTRDAHRLIAWSGSEPPGQLPLVERLFLAYFTEGANVADHGVLADLAADAGYDRARATAVLASDRLEDSVDRDIAAAVDTGITGVPAFVIDDQFLISGAQDTETFVRLLSRIQERSGAVSPASGVGRPKQ